MYSHKETYMTLDEIGKICPEYRATFDFDSKYINTSHQFYEQRPPEGGNLIQVENGNQEIIHGWLNREDALKLYELAYFVQGDVLELGSFHGLSTTILSQANHESPHRKNIYSVDLIPGFVDQTKMNLQASNLEHYVTNICSDATVAVEKFSKENKKFEFVFIDHSHEYEPVYTICKKLDTVMIKGGFCLFHDFNDPRNRDSDDQDYGVYQAVMDGLDTAKFEFYGIYGCTALYRMY